MDLILKNRETSLIWVFILLLQFFPRDLNAQDLSVFVQHGRYTEELLNSDRIKNYYFIGHAYIDPEDEGVINYTLLKKMVIKMFPNSDQTGYLVLNLENSIYDSLYAKNKGVRKKAVNRFIDLVSFVKSLRKNLKISVYGIPKRFNYDFQKEKNHIEDLLPLMKSFDFLSPDLYFSFSEKQQNKKNYKDILKDNLALFKNYSKRSGVPLLPFIWYKIDPYNEKYGRTSISKERMNILFNTIKEYKSNGAEIIGLLWWESWATIRKTTSQKLSNNIHFYLSKSKTD